MIEILKRMVQKNAASNELYSISMGALQCQKLGCGKFYHKDKGSRSSEMAPCRKTSHQLLLQLSAPEVSSKESVSLSTYTDSDSCKFRKARKRDQLWCVDCRNETKHNGLADLLPCLPILESHF